MKRLLACLLGASLSATVYTANGEDSGAGVIEEIIVTAEKREESILEVPLTMSAFNEQMIEELGMTNGNDLEQLVPGLQLGDNGEQVGQGTVIRGIGSRLAGETHSDLAVATYVDGVYTIGTFGVAPNLFDVERVEVARGPQGTLNGRNSIAGSISYFTKRPTAEWDALVQTEFTDQFTQRYNVAFGGPIIGNLSFRLNGGYFEGDGAQENIGPGGDYDAPDEKSYSGQLRYKTDRFDANVRWTKVDDKGAPRSQISLVERDRTQPFTTSGDNDPWYLWDGDVPSVADGCPPGTPGFECGDIENKLNANRPSLGVEDAEQKTAYIQYDLSDSYTLRYNFGRTDNFRQVTRDDDFTSRVGSAADSSLSADAGVPYWDGVLGTTYDYDEKSHELQLISNLDGNLNFIAGLFRYTNNTTWSVPVWDYDNEIRFVNADEAAAAGSPFLGFLPASNCAEFLTNVVEGLGIGVAGTGSGAGWVCPQGADHTQWFLFSTNGASTTQAAFVNLDYTINDSWHVSGGLRYTEDEKEQGFDGGWLTIPLFGVPMTIFFDDTDPKTRTWDKTIGHVSVEYTTESNNLVYGRISTGYRAGGFNTFSPGAPSDPIKEETLINYELGTKGIFLEQRLQITAGVFYNDYEDFQINGSKENPSFAAILPTADFPLTEFTDNISGNKLWGGEVEFIYHPSDNWRLSGFYAYQDSEIGSHAEIVRGDPNAPTAEWEHLDFDTGQQTTSTYQLPQDMTGNQLAMQPNHKYAITAAYSTPLDMGGDVQVLGTYSWTGDRYSDVSNQAIAELEAYGRLDLRATWTSPSERISATLYVQNATDEIGLIEYLRQSTNGNLPAAGSLTEPRQFGLQIRWRPEF
jgi:iron complex outermembrane recepter protein